MAYHVENPQHQSAKRHIPYGSPTPQLMTLQDLHRQQEHRLKVDWT
jgi:hypothetical protein